MALGTLQNPDLFKPPNLNDITSFVFHPSACTKRCNIQVYANLSSTKSKCACPKAFESQDYPILPVARKLGETSMMLPVHPTLDESDIDEMIAAIKKVFQHAGR